MALNITEFELVTVQGDYVTADLLIWRRYRCPTPGLNGFGYHGKGVNSPYLYGGSTLYGPPEAKGGKYTRDHYFDPNYVDKQLGTVVALKMLASMDPTIGFDPPSDAPQQDDRIAHGILWVQQSLNKLGAKTRQY